MGLTGFPLLVDFPIMFIGKYLVSLHKIWNIQKISDFLIWIWIPAAFLYGSLWMATRRKRLWLNFLGGYGGIGETLNLLDPGKAYKLMLMQISEAKELD